MVSCSGKGERPGLGGVDGVDQLGEPGAVEGGRRIRGERSLASPHRGGKIPLGDVALRHEPPEVTVGPPTRETGQRGAVRLPALIGEEKELRQQAVRQRPLGDDADRRREKLLRAIEGLEYRSGEFPAVGHPAYRVTISVGIASGPVEETQNETELVRRADRALYAAKYAGKNRVHRWTPTGSVEVAQTSA